MSMSRVRPVATAWLSSRTRFLLPSLLSLACLGAGGLTPAAAAVRVVASDARGVTLEVTVGAWGLSAPNPDGRVYVTGLGDAHTLGTPGRAALPAWSATLALPADARPTARVLSSSGEQARSDTRLVIAGRPGFIDDPASRLGPQPIMEKVAAIVDGAWPSTSVELAKPFGFRGRRLVSLELRPFRYDEAASRVWSPLALTVRVDFNRPAGAVTEALGTGAPDRHVDAALATSVLNWDQARGWRVPPTAAAGSGSLFERRPAAGAGALAFEEDEPEVRVKLTETALYRLAYDDLAAQGYPANVSVGEVSVHRHEFLEGATPPYGTVELPCEVHDANQNSVFDSGDGIVLWTRNWAERSGATVIRRYWGDAEVVFVTRKAGGGLRVPQRTAWNAVPGLTPVASYPFRKLQERDYAPMMRAVTTEVDTNVGVWNWTPYALYYSRPDTIRFETKDLDNTRDVNVSLRWVGRAADYHIMWAAFRNGVNLVSTFVDSVSWYGKTGLTRSATLPGTALTEGNTNFLRLWGKNQFAPPNASTNAISFAGLDWFDVTYWRRYRAVADQVRFNSADATGDVQMQVGGFTSDSLRVYDITDPDQPVRLTLDPAHVVVGADVAFEMQDVVAPGGRRDYVAAALPSTPVAGSGPVVPPASAYSVVTRRNLWAQATGDYLLVAPEEFVPATAPLVALRTAQGLSVLEAPVESIYDEFDGGRHSAAALERFARYAYEHWDSRFLTLVGDGTLDPMGNRAGSGKDWIPVLPSPGPVGTGGEYEIIPSDNRYGFITGADNPISGLESDPVVPELMVGRLTVNSPAEAATVVDKIVNYENVQPNEDWRRNVLLNTDDAYSGETFFGGGGSSTPGYCHRYFEEFFVDLNDLMASYIQSDSGVAGLNVEPFNLRSYLTNEDTFPGPFGDTCRVSREDTRETGHAYAHPILRGKLNAGQVLWNFQGHANEYVLTHEDMWVNNGIASSDDTNLLQNDNKPFFFTAFSCHANMFARPEVQLDPQYGPALGEDFLALPNGRGAVASWASVCYEVVPRGPTTHVNVELIRNLFVNPPRDEFLGPDDRGARVVLGEVILSTLLRYLATTQSVISERGLSVSYTLLGDPATRFSIGRPLSQVLANGTPVTSGDPVRLHTLGDTLRIDAKVVSNSRIDSVALFLNQGSGDVPVPATDYTITPSYPDTVAGGVHGGRRYHLVHRTQPGARSVTYVVVTKDRYGLVDRTDVVLRLEGVLRVSDTEISDNDEVAPGAALSMYLWSPAPIANPTTDLSLTINGNVQPFTAAPAPGDPSGREWILSWTHADYPIDSYVALVAVQGGGTVTLRFRVTAASGRLALRDLFPFPNPFDNDGTRFSFMLLGGEAADVKLHVFTQSGRSIYTEAFRDLGPGYHQLAWDGRDAEGTHLANGIYFYRLSVTTPSGATTQQLGRLVKLRKPRRSADSATP